MTLSPSLNDFMMKIEEVLKDLRTIIGKEFLNKSISEYEAV